MAQPYVGEIRQFAGNFAPRDWLFCDGQLVPISENEPLFTLIGTTYGGDGENTFALPDLRGRLPIHMGGGFQLAQTGGVEEVTLSVDQMPAHNHVLQATSTAASVPNIASALPATGAISDLYWGDPPDAQASPKAIGPAGGSQPHDNRQPSLCINYIISMFGIFPNPT